MLYNELVKRLRRLGWVRLRQGRRHEVWARDARRLAVPRHNEINEWTARAILKEASGE